MAKWWFGGALVVWCIGATAAQAQYLPPSAAPAPMPEPVPYAPGGPCNAQPMVEGPISPQAAGPGPSSCCDLPCNLPGAFQECDDPGPPGCGIWFGFEYLHWWTKDNKLPPLITTGNAADPLPGAIGQPNTQVVLPALGPADATSVVPGFGIINANTVLTGIDDGQDRSGGRFSAGWWFNRQETIGIEGNYFILNDRNFNFGGGPFGGPGLPILARPVFLNTTQGEGVSFIGLPVANFGNFANDLIVGTFNVRLTNRFWGAEANSVVNIMMLPNLRLDFLMGGRYLQLQDQLGITTTTTDFTGVQSLPGTITNMEDHFDTLNRFIGGQFGARIEWRINRLYANVCGRLALGINKERVDITGFTSFLVPGQPLVQDAGGLLALPSNINRYTRSQFTTLPQLDVNVGYNLFGWMRLFVGYSLLHLTDAVRPGEQIDRVINPTQTNHLAGGPFVGQPRPVYFFHTVDFLAQGLSLGLELRF